MARRKLTKAEREEREAHHARTLENAKRTRELAERAFAKLDPEQQARVRALAPGAPRADA
jgi:hypothetical protein